MLAIHRHAEGATQLLFIKKVSGLGKLLNPIDHFARCAVEMRDGEELGPRRGVVQTAERGFQVFDRWILRHASTPSCFQAATHRASSRVHAAGVTNSTARRMRAT